MQVDPMQLIQMIKSGQNPQQLMLNILQSNFSNSPMGANLLALAKQNKTTEIEMIARNLCKQRGIDYDTAFDSFKKNLGY